MYILIFEDGEPWKSEIVSEDDLQAADDGYLDILNIKDPNLPVRYWNGDWVAVGTWGEDDE